MDVSREGTLRVSSREEVFLGYIPLVHPDIYAAKFSGVTGLDLYLLGYFSASVNPVAFEFRLCTGS